MPTSPIIIAQLNPTVGDIVGNTQLIRQTLEKIHQQHKNALVIFPEMMICGYCPQDFLLRADFIYQCQEAVWQLAEKTQGLTVIVGSPLPEKADNVSAETLSIHNAAVVYQNGKIVATYAKQQLPNYSVFDEKRYFKKASENIVFEYDNRLIGLLICEDGWKEDSYQSLQNQKVDLIISINASPFEQGKAQQRIHIANNIQQTAKVPVIYTNMCGAQDELVFDGGSFILNDKSDLTQLPQFQTGAFVLKNIWKDKNSINKLSTNILQKIKIHHPCASEEILIPQTPNDDIKSEDAEIYGALQLGLRDYVLKNNFSKVLLGLSGGIDSALTCAIAVDALSAENVISVMLASPYTSQLSIDLAQEQAEQLGIEHHNIDLLQAMHSVENMLLPIWKTLPQQQAVSRQNIQARLRGLVLMALSNEYNALLLATGNKSELSIGYATLYGDMAGGFSPIKDVYKTKVYALSNYRNAVSPVIPKDVIERPPTAELAPDQKDTDSLPEYFILDAILEKFIEQRLSAEQIIKQGYASDVVKRVINATLRNQHKRQQASIGTKITATAFGKDFRYPNTQRWQ